MQDSFKWFDCPFVLRREREGALEYLSLKPQVELFYDNDEKQPIEVNVKMEKTFNIDDELGFTWHKSWIIPEIFIKIRDFESNDFESTDLECEITSGFPVKRNDAYFINEVRVDGQTTRSLRNYESRFNNLKFTTTSFNTEGNKFSLLLILYLNQNGTKKILKCMISMPIYIDSRKEARAKKQTVAKIQDVFPPEKMTQTIILKKKDDDFQVENDIQGFLEYYTVNHKKSKIKHPFFVCYKFSNCFTLYYNSKDIKESFNMYYHILMSIYNERKNSVILYTPFMSNNYKKKIQNVVDSWQLDFMRLIMSKQQIPQHYKPISTDKLLQSYRQYHKKFERMSNIRKNMGAFEDDNEVVRCQIVVQKGGLTIQQIMRQQTKIEDI